MDELLNIVGNVGFPIAVAAYLLIRIEGKLSDLAAAISELRETILLLPNHFYHELNVTKNIPNLSGDNRTQVSANS